MLAQPHTARTEPHPPAHGSAVAPARHPPALAGTQRASAAAVLDAMPSVMDAMRGAMRRQVGETLSVPQFRCLKYIAREPGCSLSAVAGFLGVTLPTASVMVDRLVKAGAVEPRRAAADDRRRSALKASVAGLAQLRQIELGALDELAAAMDGYSGAELQTVRDAMALLQRAFQPLCSSAPNPTHASPAIGLAPART